ncbi:hypothetical protein E2C01_096632 [Portunus trituberculatus]|uniref:Uncharacterized protein n=1 Tax=Portunus trituberculatus TaxID=210409 RepID=A0A5B7K7R0_PORTR|nr:hypothetical protein [Portunus trituberculatus]
MHDEKGGTDLANPRKRTKPYEISKPACWKMGANAEQYQYPLMDGKNKCFVSQRKIKNICKVHHRGRKRMTTHGLTTTTEDKTLCLSSQAVA